MKNFLIALLLLSLLLAGCVGSSTPESQHTQGAAGKTPPSETTETIPEQTASDTLPDAVPETSRGGDTDMSATPPGQQTEQQIPDASLPQGEGPGERVDSSVS